VRDARPTGHRPEAQGSDPIFRDDLYGLLEQDLAEVSVVIRHQIALLVGIDVDTVKIAW
jgi:hypothetical protein